MSAKDESRENKRSDTKYGHLLGEDGPGEQSPASEETAAAEESVPVTLDSLTVTVTDETQSPAERYHVHVAITEREGPIATSIERELQLAESNQWDPDGFVPWNSLRLLVKHRVTERLAGVDEPSSLRPSSEEARA